MTILDELEAALAKTYPVDPARRPHGFDLAIAREELLATCRRLLPALISRMRALEAVAEAAREQRPYGPWTRLVCALQALDALGKEVP